MYDIFKDFSYDLSPRGIIEKVLLGTDILSDKTIWYCLTCDVCTEGCPAGVRFRDFVESARDLSVEKGLAGSGAFCARCGSYFVPVHTLDYLQEKLGGRQVSLEFLSLCPRCRKYEQSRKVKDLVPGSKRIS
jgi:Fe-S oxidoreductase